DTTAEHVAAMLNSPDVDVVIALWRDPDAPGGIGVWVAKGLPIHRRPPRAGQTVRAEHPGSLSIVDQLERPACSKGPSPRLDVKGHAAARPQRDTCYRVRPMPGDRIETKGVNQNCQNDSRLDHREAAKVVLRRVLINCGCLAIGG